MSRSRIGLIGPDASQPCGIADYVERLGAALAAECELTFVPFREALASSRLEPCQAILVHYERSLVPDAGFLTRLGARFPGRMFVVPHEVYAEDPFAFPYADLRANFPPWLWLKRALYRRRHREYARERRLQAAGYAAQGVIPLSGPNAAILGPLAPGKILDPVPHAFYAPPEGSPAPRREDFFPRGPKAILGIFGFLNPASDYAQVFDLMAGLDPGTALLILGGDRSAGDMQGRLERDVAVRGLSERVRITGWLPPERVGAHLNLCDLFVSPMRFKSNSGSLLHLFHLGRPILVPDLPLTRWLREEGAPLDLYRDGTELRRLALGYLEGKARPPANRYRWDFPTVARAYLRAMGVG
jgi:glycosyltransferase involved in cell wall biosynthesis